MEYCLINSSLIFLLFVKKRKSVKFYSKGSWKRSSINLTRLAQMFIRLIVS